MEAEIHGTGLCHNCCGEYETTVLNRNGDFETIICEWCTKGEMSIRQFDDYAEYINSMG